MKSVYQVIKTIGKEFISMGLEIKNFVENPIKQFEMWIEEAINKIEDLSNAMLLLQQILKGNHQSGLCF